MTPEQLIAEVERTSTVFAAATAKLDAIKARLIAVGKEFDAAEKQYLDAYRAAKEAEDAADAETERELVMGGGL